MKPRSIIILIILFFVLLIAGINWTAFTTPIAISLLFTTIHVPLGLSLLTVIAALSVIYLVFLGKTQAAAMLDSHQRNKELEKARKLADSEEESRLNALGNSIESEMASIHEKLDLILGKFKEEDIQQTEEPEGKNRLGV